MKRLRDRRRIHSFPVIHFDIEEQQTELTNLRRVPSQKENQPEEEGIRKTRDSSGEPSDVARRLWCQAGHF